MTSVGVIYTGMDVNIRILIVKTSSTPIKMTDHDILFTIFKRICGIVNEWKRTLRDVYTPSTKPNLMPFAWLATELVRLFLGANPIAPAMYELETSVEGWKPSNQQSS